MSINTGGTAFPNSDDQAAHASGAAAIAGITDPAERDRVYIAARGAAMQGMTLRDYFAAKALPAILAQEEDGIQAYSPCNECPHGETAAQMWARHAYEIADAMLAARGAA